MVGANKEAHKEGMLNDAFPAMKAISPSPSASVLVRQDYAPPRNIGNDPGIAAAGTSDGWNITLLNQPAESPDTNILDLRFFNSIQSLQNRTPFNTVDKLVVEVKRVFNVQDSDTLGRGWTTYQAVLKRTMLAKGDSTFKSPNPHKQTRARRGASAARALHCSDEAWVATHL